MRKEAYEKRRITKAFFGGKTREGKSTRTLARAQKSGIQRLQFEKRPTKEP